MEQRIPKVIHYCWFGENPKPKLTLKCIESWKKQCPDYEIVEWNERNFDVHCNSLVEGAYLAKKWAFVSDYVRVHALLLRGGIYLDTDYELLHSLDFVLSNSFFAGFEAKDSLGTAIFGCEKNNKIISQFLDYYQDKEFCRNGDAAITTSPIVLTNILKQKGLRLNGKQQRLSDCTIYPKMLFYPTDLGWVFGRYGSNTVGVHHYMNSWGEKNTLDARCLLSKLRLSILYHARDFFGTNTLHQIGKKIRIIRPHK